MRLQATTAPSLAIHLDPLLATGQPLSGTQENVRRGAQPAGNAMQSGPVTYHLPVSGTVPDGAILSALMKRVEETRPANPDQVRTLFKSMKIDSGMPSRISRNVAVPRQTQGATSGERGNAGPPRTSARRGAAAAANAATGHAPEEIMIVLCDDAEQEQEALGLMPAQWEAARATGEKAPSRVDGEPRPFPSLVRRVGTPGGGKWSWLSGNALA